MPIFQSLLYFYLQMVPWVRGNQCFRAGLWVQLGREVQCGHLVQQDPGEGKRKYSRK